MTSTTTCTDHLACRVAADQAPLVAHLGPLTTTAAGTSLCEVRSRHGVLGEVVVKTDDTHDQPGFVTYVSLYCAGSHVATWSEFHGLADISRVIFGLLTDATHGAERHARETSPARSAALHR